MLPSTTLGLSLIIGVFVLCITSCSSDSATEVEWSEAQSSHRGTVTHISIPPSGTATFELKLKPGKEYEGLPAGQIELRCQVLPTERKSLDWVLKQLRVGDFVTVIGETGPVGDDERVGIQRVGMIAVF